VGVISPGEMNSSTPPVNDVLASIIMVGVVGLPIGWVLVRFPSSIPPKQYWSVQTVADCFHCIRNNQPVELYLTAKVMPELGSSNVRVSVHCEA